MGGRVISCLHCGDEQHFYNSCGDRHCPACGGAKRARWLEARRAEQLPTGYFHVVFTVPHELSSLMMGNRKVLYDLLMSTAWQTLSQLGADEKYLNAQLGAIAVLHTWGQQLEHHPHVHMIVPGGGLSLDGERWIASRPNFLLPVKVLGKLFRGKFLAGLQAANAAGDLNFAGGTAALAEPREFQTLLSRLYAKDWVVYAKEPFHSPETMLKYLAGYTHRVALSNHRLSNYDGHSVSLSYKDYADGCKRKELRLSAAELIRRFSLHIVPKGFVRIRHFGILSHRDRGKRLQKCRELLTKPNASTPLPTVPLLTEPLLTEPLVTEPLVTVPLVTVPLVTEPLVTVPLAGALPAEEPASVLARSLSMATVLVVAALATPTALSSAVGVPPLSPLPLSVPVLTERASLPPQCPKCGGVEFATPWQGARPVGRRWQEVQPWNTS